ncbi:MAG: hypothetical protein ABSF54_04255 [Bryobacteraceae bacterium]|jgi:hypothetical protein
MNRLPTTAVLACCAAGICCAARCTTVLNPAILTEYDNYVAAAERSMSSRFDAGELRWLPDYAAKEAAARLASGKLVRWNIGDAALNRRLAGQNGAVVHWIGAIRIHGASLADLESVLADYDGYERIYRPMVFACQAKRAAEGPNTAYDVTLGLRSSFRFASVFPQHYAFRIKGRIDYADSNPSGGAALRIHLGSSEIRESDSGEPGHSDFLEPYHDHGIMWALNAYWRARRRGPDIYLEFESITLARSVQSFACTLGIVPVPKAVVSGVMDSLPADTISVILEATKAECERRAARPVPHVSGL